MRYLALAADYDGTLAVDGRISEAAAQAIERIRGLRLTAVETGQQEALRSRRPQRETIAAPLHVESSGKLLLVGRIERQDAVPRQVDRVETRHEVQRRSEPGPQFAPWRRLAGCPHRRGHDCRDRVGLERRPVDATEHPGSPAARQGMRHAKAQARIRSIGKRFVGRGGSGDEVGHDEQEFTHIAYGSEA